MKTSGVGFAPKLLILTPMVTLVVTELLEKFCWLKPAVCCAWLGNADDGVAGETEDAAGIGRHAAVEANASVGGAQRVEMAGVKVWFQSVVKRWSG